MSPTLRVLRLLGIAVFAIGCASRDTSRDAAGVPVTMQQYGDDWPFTVERGDLWCISPGKNVVFVADDVVYALNDEARAAKRWRDIEGPIWRENPKMPGTKVSLSTLIHRGLMLCDDFVPVLVTDP
jgi:hypothetical protein